MSNTLLLGDCLDKLKELPDNSIDSIVTDPPYGLIRNKKGGSGSASINLNNPAGGFMGQKWDSDVPSVEIWAECFRVLKPGGHLLAFAGTRTQHRMATRIEDAGFEIRDMIAWCYGSGFPKSLDVSKAIDKAAGAEPIDLGISPNWRESKRDREKNGSMEVRGENAGRITAPATPEAQQWSGWGTALKPALEPITVARKPLIGTVAANVMEHGTGGLNIDGCRVGSQIEPSGRWPANLIHDGSEEVLAAFPANAGAAAPVKGTEASMASVGTVTGKRDRVPGAFHSDTGSAARFFYCPKTSKRERGEGNSHPTVKPVALMRYLCRLVTPPGGLVLDPFMGSGSTGIAALKEGFDFVGIEMDPSYMDIAKLRIESSTK